MQTVRLVQAVALMIIVALAASCAASKEYTSKLFAPRNQVTEIKDTQAMALKFLDLDQVEPDKDNWVTTDIIMGRDTSTGTAALDNFSKTFPASPVLPVKKDSVSLKEKEVKENKSPAILTEVKPELKPAPEPFAKMYNPGEVRVKKSREEK
jgi:hypothetical protein